MLKRLPISLKIDDDDSDFYYGLIEEKRKNRELTTLILNLLKLYHINEEVRKAADDYMVSQNPYLKIHEELQRITLEHRKQTTATGMIGDYTRNEMNRTINKTYEPDSEYEKEKEEQAKQILVLQDEIESLKTRIKDQVSIPVVPPTVVPPTIVTPDIATTEPTIEKPTLDIPAKESIVMEVSKEVAEVTTEEKNVQEVPKAVPKSFKKMMSSVK